MTKTPIKNVLDTDRIGRLLFKLSLPAFLGMFVQTLYNVINTIFVGQYVGTNAIAGLTIVFPLQMLGMGVGMMVGIGGTSLISRYLGAGRNEDAEKALGNGLLLGLLVSAVVLAVILPFVDYWLTLIGASAEVLPYARDYLNIIMYAMVFQVFAMALLNFARAEGNARVGMVAMMIGAGINIAFDAIFIAWLDLGVKGAGWATFLSQTISLTYMAIYYATGNSYLKIRLKNFKLDFAVLKPIAAIGIGAFLQTFAGSLSAMVLINMVADYGGDIAVSGFGIVQRFMMFAIMPAIVLGQGAQPIFGYNYGARRYGLVVKTIYLATATATILSLVVFLIVFFIPEAIVSLFSSDPELIKVGAEGMKLMFLTTPFLGVILVGTNLFQALGKVVPAFIASVGRPAGFLVPIALILPRFMGITGAWISIPVADMLTFFMVIILVLPVIRQLRKNPGEKQPVTPGDEEPTPSPAID